MLSLLELSLTGGVFILAVVVVRALAMNRLPRQAFLLLWAVALARLLLPFSIPSPTSLYSAAGHLGEGFRRAGIVTAGGTDAAGAAAQEAVIPWMALLWAAGALACALCFLLPHLRGRREWNASLPVEDPFVTAWLAGHPIRRKVRVRCSDRVDSPLTYGLLRPVILLPKTLDRSDVSRLAFVLTHEMAHIRRFDALSKLLLAAAACLHWFNPLVWVMLVLANRDLELSCDAAVVRLYGAEARAPYARTLLELEARRSRFLPLCSAFNKNALEERIGAIMRSRKTSAAALAVALVLVVALTAVLATNAPRERPIASASGLTIRDNGVVTAYQEGVWDSSGELKPDPQTGHYYTKEQYEQVAALKTEGYESLSIAEFNRTLYAALNESEALSEAFGRVLMDLPETDPLAPFLVNTAQPSLNEYNARLNEVYSGRAEDPSFSGQLSRTETANVYGDTVEVGWTEAGYSFTYRILDLTDNSGGSELYWEQLLVAPHIDHPLSSRHLALVRRSANNNPYLDEAFSPSAFRPLSTLPELPGLDAADRALATDVLTVSHTVEPAAKPSPFRGRIWVLVDESVYSASESFVLFCQQTGFATLVGRTTGGDGIGAMDPVYLQLPNSGILIQYTVPFGLNPDGSSNEEMGTTPDLVSPAEEPPLITAFRAIGEA